MGQLLVRDHALTTRWAGLFLIRLLSAVIGCGLVWWSHFYIFAILAESSASKELGSMFAHLQDSWINVVVGELAASVGRSYWHDLNKVRNLKGVAQEMGSWRPKDP